MLSLSRSLLAAPVLACLVSTVTAQEVLTVGPDGLSPFSSIQTAVNAASPGSLIVVRPGDYTEVVDLGSKPLQLVAPLGATLFRGLRIEGLARNESVLVHGLRIRESGQLFKPAVSCKDSAGSIVFQECDIEGEQNLDYITNAGQTALALDGCARVTAIRSTFRGGPAPFMTGNGWERGGDGVSAASSQMALYDCELLGGDGEFIFPLEYWGGGRGGHGLLLQDSRAYAAGCTMRGADGGSSGSGFGFPPGGDGGDGANVTPGSMFLDRAGTYSGGVGGAAMGGTVGTQGIGVDSSGAYRTLPGQVQRSSGPIFARNVSSYSLQVQGPASSNATLFISEDTPFFFDVRGGGLASPANAPAIGAPTSGAIPLGSTDASGNLFATVGIPDLPLQPASRPFAFVIDFGSRRYNPRRGHPVPVVALQCATAGEDCNGNGIADLCEFLDGSLVDTNGNLVPDSCEP